MVRGKSFKCIMNLIPVESYPELSDLLGQYEQLDTAGLSVRLKNPVTHSLTQRGRLKKAFPLLKKL